MKKATIIKDVSEFAYEITKLIQFSPKRETIFHALKEAVSPDTLGVSVRWSMRWTVRAKTSEKYGGMEKWS